MGLAGVRLRTYRIGKRTFTTSKDVESFLKSVAEVTSNPICMVHHDLTASSGELTANTFHERAS